MQATQISRELTATNLTRRTILTTEDLRKRAPSAFATKASNKMSDRYAFIPSTVAIDALRKMDLLPVEASQRRAQAVDSARHLIRFARKEDLVAKAVKDEVYPEVVLSNSHNGRCAWKLYLGLFRCICANGMIVADQMFAGMVRRHIGEVKEIMAEAEEVLGRMKQITPRISAMRKTALTESARHDFAAAALALRYTDPDSGKILAPIMPKDLLAVRRPQDNGMDLWHTFNVVQENLMRGGLEGKSAGGRVVHTREVKDVRKVLTFNTDLWTLAVERIAA